VCVAPRSGRARFRAHHSAHRPPGRAQVHGLGVDAAQSDLPAELTITDDGAFWGPFGPTVNGGKLDTDLLITRTTLPLSVPAEALLASWKTDPKERSPHLTFVERDPPRPVRALQHQLKSPTSQRVT
jgi:hypothetical protein